jgi:hypothetical protein
MSEYVIKVTRLDPSVSNGKLEFWIDGDQVFVCDCFEDPENLISPSIYPGCSATMMYEKQKPGIYIKDAISNRTGSHSIFIHHGDNQAWSDGCIVINENDMLTMWGMIEPKDGYNVLVTVD